MLLNFLHMERLHLKNSFSSSNTVKTTYARGKTVSQLDHVLGKQHSRIKMGRITAKWTTISDHKMLTVPVMINRVTEEKTRQKKRKSELVRTSSTHDEAKEDEAKRRCREGRRNWNLEALWDVKTKERYMEEIRTRIAEVRIADGEQRVGGTDPTDEGKRIEMDWKILRENIEGAADEILTVTKPPCSPRKKEVGRRLERIMKMRAMDKHNPIWKQRERDTKKEK
jgi:archaellum component FlaC